MLKKNQVIFFIKRRINDIINPIKLINKNYLNHKVMDLIIKIFIKDSQYKMRNIKIFKFLY